MYFCANVVAQQPKDKNQCVLGRLIYNSAVEKNLTHLSTISSNMYQDITDILT